MATKVENITDPQSCFNRAQNDEPIFVLRAHDPLAPETVRRWAYARGLAVGPDATYEEALLVADAMEEWRSANG